MTLESNQYERNLKNAQKQWNDFMRGIGMSTSKFTAAAAGIATVTGALKVAKDAFFANENALDEWGRTVESSKSIYNGFLNALNNADISGFLSKMDDIVSAARNAYDALDELNTYNAFNQRNEMKERAKYTEALDAYKLNPTAENKQALAAANKAVMDGLRETQQKTEDAYIAGLRNLATQRLNSKDLQDAFVKVFSEGGRNALSDAKTGYSTGRGLNAGAQYYYGDRVYDGRIQDRGTGKWRDMTDTERQNFEFARALSQVNDSQIKEVQALGRQSQSIADQIYQQDRAYNRLAGNNAKIGGDGGRSGGGRARGRTSATPTTEIQQNQKKINDLTQEYIRLGDKSTDSARQRQEAIQAEIQLLKERNGLLGLRAEQAQGRLLSNAGDFDRRGISVNGGLFGNPFAEDNRKTKTTGSLKLQLDSKAMASVMRDVQKGLPDKDRSAVDVMSQMNSGISSIVGGIEGLGIELPAGMKEMVGGISSMLSVLQGIATLVEGVQALQEIGTVFRFEHGGIVPHAASGYMIPGNDYSDRTPVLAQSGELILNRAQQGNLASQLSGRDASREYTPSHVSGEQIWIALNAFTKRTGKGELVTWK